MCTMNYAAYDHQGKARLYLEALSTRYGRVKITQDDPFPPVDFVLTDHDVRGRRSHLERLRSAGADHFFVYPHAARPNLVNDIRATWPHTTASFVAARGHAEIMRRFGYPKPVHVVGWHLCPLRDFQPRERAWRVLFAPIHPRCAKIDQELNRAAFEKLRVLAEAGQIRLTVRYLGRLQDGGLENVKHKRIRYSAGSTKPSWDEIDHADVVVGHQTFAWLAVARGVPTVMMGEDMPTHLVPKNQDALFVQHWDWYADLLKFPLDIMTEADTVGLLQRAVQSDAEIRTWRRRMIGKPFDAELFLEHIESYVRDWKSNGRPKIKSRYQGRGDVYFIVNAHGTVHDCVWAQAETRLQSDDYRLATDKEIEQYAGWGVLNRIVR